MSTLWLKKLASSRKPDWRFWLVVHVLALALQWASIEAAPIVMQKANAKGWWALCVTAKGP